MLALHDKNERKSLFVECATVKKTGRSVQLKTLFETLRAEAQTISLRLNADAAA
jgi:hypothetical protein